MLILKTEPYFSSVHNDTDHHSNLYGVNETSNNCEITSFLNTSTKQNHKDIGSGNISLVPDVILGVSEKTSMNYSVDNITPCFSKTEDLSVLPSTCSVDSNLYSDIIPQLNIFEVINTDDTKSHNSSGSTMDNKKHNTDSYINDDVLLKPQRPKNRYTSIEKEFTMMWNNISVNKEDAVDILESEPDTCLIKYQLIVDHMSEETDYKSDHTFTDTGDRCK